MQFPGSIPFTPNPFRKRVLSAPHGANSFNLVQAPIAMGDPIFLTELPLIKCIHPLYSMTAFLILTIQWNSLVFHLYAQGYIQSHATP